ncbi:MAG: sigma-54 dependent transcriptional regulator [Chromatiales bacterium]|nr:sigma-54 dependent transcriptional regulator [Chromatiales bacterium]
MKFSVLIAEDDRDMAALLAEIVREQGFDCEVAADGLAAETALRQDETHMLLTDLRLPGRSGLQLLHIARAVDPRMPVVMITGYATPQNTIQAFQEGVFDMILKPVEPDQVRLVLRRVQGLLEHRQRILQLSTQLARERETVAPVAASAAMKKVLGLVSQVAETELPVLLLGETGTGKGVMAAHIHALSPRAGDAFLSVNCGAISPTLLESELFGHERGAFTGAISRRVGLLELAHGGTLFLDEINSASPDMQVRLLQFIQERRFFRVGGTRPIDVDVRLIFAANKDLRQLVDSGEFREDLFYRLNVFPIGIPPLRERKEDIPVLAEYMLLRHGRALGKDLREIDAAALQALADYRWPGNVRELENVIQRSLVLACGDSVSTADLPAEIVASGARLPSIGFPWGDRTALADVERCWIRHVLDRHQGNRTRAAQALGIDPSTLWRKLKDADDASDDV